jgi:hypothetical protein
MDASQQLAVRVAVIATISLLFIISNLFDWEVHVVTTCNKIQKQGAVSSTTFIDYTISEQRLKSLGLRFLKHNKT